MPIMNAPMETCSDINELQIVSHNSLFNDEISLFSPIIIMPAFGNWSFIEKFCSINYTNNLRGFALISVLNISNRCFDSSLGEFNTITRKFANFLTREK